MKLSIKIGLERDWNWNDWKLESGTEAVWRKNDGTEKGCLSRWLNGDSAA
ncbi:MULTISPECIES: hypothetical protein [Peribacillus]|nr:MULTISPECIES: hypothetical protein [Peribacillus]MCM3675552.1 hypothetical protein [Peribacillus simplex]MDQ0883285.1 hypothetical protein [Peribacillus sp. V2I11]